MTIVAGMFSYVEGRGLDERACRALAGVLSRDDSDTVEEYRDDHCYLAKVDIGAYSEPAFHRDGNESAGILVGEPLLGDGAVRHSRGEDLNRLHEAWLVDDRLPLRRTHGTFAAVHYDRRRRRLALVADKIGVRPLYWWHGAGVVVFASALRILEAMDLVPKIMDLRGAAETIAFGFPLGTRTQYRSIQCLYGGELLEITPKGPKSETYWRWDRLEADPLPVEAAAAELYRKHGEIFARRLRPDERSVLCFLSGGLDSRCIASELMRQDRTVHTYNFSRPGTYNQVLSTLFAEKLGSEHHAWHMPVAPRVHVIEYLGQAIAQDFPDPASLPERPTLIWSGDGGSVGLGHVYLNLEVIEAMRAGREDAAIKAFIDYNRLSLPTRFLSGPAQRMLAQIIDQGIREELKRFECNDAGRNFHVFLLLNDQRRHLVAHYENVDTTRFDMHLPFFDSDLLETVYRIPLEELLYHRFYYKWLEHFPPVVTSVPWQAYPNHVPCPLPMPEGFRSQWQEKGAALPRGPRWTEKQVRTAMRDKAFPNQIWSRSRLRLARWATALGVRDYGYVLRAALTSYDIARKCDRAPDVSRQS